MTAMPPVKIALIGAGSRSFGPATITDVLLSEPLREAGIELALMDIAAAPLEEMLRYARFANEKLEARARLTATTNLDEAVRNAAFVVCAIDVERFKYWTMDFHVPRHYGFRQVFGENGGPGSLFHALRNMGPTVEIARAMERLCPGAWLLSFSNPEHKLCQAVSMLTRTPVVGLCHGVFMGLAQAAHVLGRPADSVDGDACGINHFTFFQTLRDRATGEDLYPALRKVETEGDWLSDWHEIGLARVLFRRFGLWPSPAANHYGEYIRWAEEFVASELHFFYDPADGHPWDTGRIPEFVYSLSGDKTTRPMQRPATPPAPLESRPLKSSGELAIPIMEGIAGGQSRPLAAVNVPNRGAIPGLPDDLVVEVPARADADGLHPQQMNPLPEGVAALVRVQASIMKLLVEAFAEQSRDKLIQAMLLEPTVDSYHRAVSMVEEMIRLQRDRLPPLR